MRGKLSPSILLSLVIFCVYLIPNNFASSDSDDTDNRITDFVKKHSKNGSDVNLDDWVAPEEMSKHLVYYLSGHDQEDRPIWVIELGKWDVKTNVEGSPERVKLYDLYSEQMLLRFLQSVEKQRTPDNPRPQIILIFDMEDYPIQQLASVKALVYHLKTLTSWINHIDAVNKGFVLNTNFVAERLINLIKPVLGPSIEKFEIFGTNKAKWIPRLLKELPRSQIAEWYGGTKDFKPVKTYGR